MYQLVMHILKMHILNTHILKPTYSKQNENCTVTNRSNCLNLLRQQFCDNNGKIKTSCEKTDKEWCCRFWALIIHLLQTHAIFKNVTTVEIYFRKKYKSWDVHVAPPHRVLTDSVQQYHNYLRALSLSLSLSHTHLSLSFSLSLPLSIYIYIIIYISINK